MAWCCGMTWLGTEPWAGLSRGTQEDPNNQGPKQPSQGPSKDPYKEGHRPGAQARTLYKGPSQDPSIHGRTQVHVSVWCKGPSTQRPKQGPLYPRTQARTQAPKDPRQGQARTLIRNRKRRPGLDPSKGPPSALFSVGWAQANQDTITD